MQVCCAVPCWSQAPICSAVVGCLVRACMRRRNGRDVVPFDVLYEGWRCPGSIPQQGILELGVACLPEDASPWWLNAR